jgi:hypothetical protein
VKNTLELPMKLWKKISIGIGIALIVSFIAIVVAGWYLFKGMCGNRIYKQYVAPDGKLKAVVFQRDCGATTGFSTQVSILEANENLNNEVGNIYIIDGQPETVAPMISWVGNNKLIIYRLINGSEYKAEKKWGFFKSVDIIYEKGGS